MELNDSPEIPDTGGDMHIPASLKRITTAVAVALAAVTATAGEVAKVENDSTLKQPQKRKKKKKEKEKGGGHLTGTTTLHLLAVSSDSVGRLLSEQVLNQDDARDTRTGRIRAE